ncbi:MAG: hypothetical protein C0422_05650 [Alcaligenaceae bacterium]|nr:hypothetical protein [Alcaligenaceae bacterium]
MRDNYFILGSRAAVIGLQLVNIKLMTAYLSTEDIGLYFFLISASYFSNALLFVPVDYYQQAFISSAKERIDAIKRALLFNFRILKLYVIPVVLIGLSLLISDYGEFIALFGLGALGSVALHGVQSMRNLLNNFGYSSTVSISQVLEACSRVGIFLIGCLLDFASLNMIAIAWASSLGLTFIHLVFKGIQGGLFKGQSKEQVALKDFLKFATPISFSAVTSWLQVQGYRVALVPLGYAEAVGIFSTISNIGSSAIGAVNLIYQQKFNPKIYQSQGGYTLQYLKYASLLILITVVTFVLVGQPIVRLLTTPEFHQYWNVILYGVAADSAYLIIGALTIHLTLKKTANAILLFSTIGFLINAVIYIVLHFTEAITINSIGIPILISQWAVAGLLFYQFKTKLNL